MNSHDDSWGTDDAGNPVIIPGGWEPVLTYAVSRAWTTDLEPGTWYEIVRADRPQIIAGWVFAEPRAGTSVWDFRAVDGHRIPARDNSHDTAGWLAAVTAYRKTH